MKAAAFEDPEMDQTTKAVALVLLVAALIVCTSIRYLVYSQVPYPPVT